MVHELTIRARTRGERIAAFYQKGIARVQDRWMGAGQTGERFRSEKHVYSEDLDLFGPGSLFELLSTARLPMGENRLANWLRFPSPKSEILERQQLVAELRGKLELREDFAVLGESLQSRLNPESLTGWGEAERVMPASVAWRVAAGTLAASAAVAIAYYLESRVAWPALSVLIVEGMVLLWLRRRAKTTIEGIECNAEGLQLFSKILQRIERESFEAARLKGFVAELNRGELPASQLVGKLARIVYWIDSRDNLLARAGELPLLYTVQVAFVAEAWRRRWGTASIPACPSSSASSAITMSAAPSSSRPRASASPA